MLDPNSLNKYPENHMEDIKENKYVDMVLKGFSASYW